MTSHTPGPWTVEPAFATSSGLRVQCASEVQGLPRTVAVVKHISSPNGIDSDAEANAHLIAQAPALLAALEYLRPALPALIGAALTREELAEIDRTIAAARGGA